ncbi:MAG: hypothetical protein ACP5HS_01305 [Anaerolineae bacterium]
MTTIQQPTATLGGGAAEPEAEVGANGGVPISLTIGLPFVLLLFAGTYILGWYNAYRLSIRFLENANQSYQEGQYLEALTGGEVYNEEEQQYEQLGGYIDVERIWSHRYSWPKPGLVGDAEQRIDEIISQHLTIAQAEQYIQANIGKNAPHFAEIYLRLGELYLQEGDEMAARDIFESVPELFPRLEDLIQEAQKYLEELEQSQ